MSKYTERDMSMAKEKLKMDSAQIAQIMGTVGSPLIVISELLKNAVDASAENIDIYYDFDSRSITVENDYKGFTFEEIQNLSKIKYRNGLREAIYKLADDMSER